MYGHILYIIMYIYINIYIYSHEKLLPEVYDNTVYFQVMAVWILDFLYTM